LSNPGKYDDESKDKSFKNLTDENTYKEARSKLQKEGQIDQGAPTASGAGSFDTSQYMFTRASFGNAFGVNFPGKFGVSNPYNNTSFNTNLGGGFGDTADIKSEGVVDVKKIKLLVYLLENLLEN
jgi:hypothetical protein